MKFARHKRRVPVKKFMDGHYLFFGLGAMDRLESQYGEDWFNQIIQNLDRVNAKAIKAVMDVALKKEDGSGANLPDNMNDWPEIEAKQLADWCLDAVCLGQRGMTWDEVVAKAKANEKKTETEAMTAAVQALMTSGDSGASSA